MIWNQPGELEQNWTHNTFTYRMLTGVESPDFHTSLDKIFFKLVVGHDEKLWLPVVHITFAFVPTQLN